MRHSLLFLSFIICVNTLSNAQKVGLVFSGGAAKGLAHIGVLKALEENDIPVDYVVGTSMGGIIGGFYAAGMSPEQIEQIALSPSFQRWVNGSPDGGYNNFFHRSDDNPHFLKLNLSLDSTLNVQLNSSLASDVSINFVLTEAMAQAEAISRQNFDSLFIPLRVIASDVFTQSEIVLKKGHLSDALRATQTVPLFYNPIRVDGKYLFDGGVYNNFPVDVAQREFGPDVIIGVNVSAKVYNEYPYDHDEKLISKSLLFLLLDKSDPTQIPEQGVYIQPDLRGYSSFDFGMAKSLIDSGYAQTMRQMDEIKRKIKSRRDCEEAMTLRNAFTSRSHPMVFDGVTYKTFNSRQRKYINRMFRIKANKPHQDLTFSEIKKGYYKLVSEDYFTNVYPNIIFDEEKEKFQLQLTRRPQKNFQVDFGGVIATRDVSNIFLGLNYYDFNTKLWHAYLGFQTGNFYKSIVANTRLDFPFQFYIEPKVTFNSWAYLENQDLLREVAKPTVAKRINRTYGGDLGWPLKRTSRTTLSIEGLNNVDYYSNESVYRSTDTLDVARIKGLKIALSFSTNTLNRKQYASSGKSLALTFSYYNLRENYTPGSTSVKPAAHHSFQWFRAKLSAEQYFNAGWFKPGYLAEIVVSNQTFLTNYYGTMLNAPAFFPLQDSRTLVLQNFRAFNYAAAGLRGVFSLKKRIDFRLEGFLFKPIEYLTEGPGQEPATDSPDLNSVFFAGAATLVHQSPIGPIALSVNYYDDNENQLGVLLHVGFLLFQKHSLE
jgi:NTE family protein